VSYDGADNDMGFNLVGELEAIWSPAPDEKEEGS